MGPMRSKQNSTGRRGRKSHQALVAVLALSKTCDQYFWFEVVRIKMNTMNIRGRYNGKNFESQAFNKGFS